MIMQNKKTVIVVTVMLAMSALAIAASVTAGVMYHKIRSFDAKYKCNVLAGIVAKDTADKQVKQEPFSKYVVTDDENLATIAFKFGVSPKAICELNGMSKDDTLVPGQIIKIPNRSSRARPRVANTNKGEKKEIAVAEKPKEEEPANQENSEAAKKTLEVDRVEYDGETTISVVFNERPDMDVVRHYIKVDPLIDGIVGFRYNAKYSYSKSEYEPIISITGNFAFRTNVTLRVLRGFPLYGKGANPNPEGSLAKDFVKVLRRNDPDPSVGFADNGRYLPPGGRNAVRLEAICVSNIATEIRRVEPRNVVQMLAREEKVYRRNNWCNASADEEDTGELAGLCETGLIRCVNRPCEKETCLFPVAMSDGGPERGVFLMTMRNGDLPRCEGLWANEEFNPNQYRLVCLSDLGLSVRNGKKTLGVWVASLTSGLPVANASVQVYSSANILVAEGETDANGWCEPKSCAKGDPFAVVVWTPTDMTFLALRDSMAVDEMDENGTRPEYLDAKDLDAFVWTERGIYRHGERIFVHAMVRDDTLKAPSPLPINLALCNPAGDVRETKTIVTDADGSLAYDRFAVPEEQPSGIWKIRASMPGENGKVLAEREVKIEEFAPPQIRVNVLADATQHPSNFTFTIAAEHLFGGPAKTLACEGAVVFEDVPFAPKGWKGFTFGNEQLGLKPSFRKMSARALDENGKCEYDAPIWADSGLPKAAVRATGQGVVFEDGGRPATARKSVVCHYYPFYIGSNLPSWLKMSEASATKIDLVCVDTNGKPIAGPRKLYGKIERIDSVYSYRKDEAGHSTWDCDRVRTTILDHIEIPIDEKGCAEYALPLRKCGDYALTVEDPETRSSFGRVFYLSHWGDDVVRAPLSNPTEVTIRPNKSFYRIGESPRLVVKSPFNGYAIMSVMREDRVYDEIVNLTNATSEIVLRPVERSWAPNVDVSLSVVQSVNANAKHLAARAHGRATILVRPVESEIGVNLDATVEPNRESGGSRVTVEVGAPDATSAMVTLVDEGINLLTGEKIPDPVARFSRSRDGKLGLFDIYGKILPVADDGLRASGVKTGGGFGAEMLGRVSPVPTRRFKPLAMWKEKVDIRDGKGRITFDLPEFIGEVRVTAVAYSATATGAAAIQRKVAPKLVMQPDAPRFVAPGDAYDVTLTLRNTSSKSGSVRYDVTDAMRGEIVLAAGDSTNLVCRKAAPAQPGEVGIKFKAEGLGETHQSEIMIPVRPAVAWRETSGVRRLEAGDDFTMSAENGRSKFALQLSGTPVADLVAAMEWLAEYPHGCLEQTASRIFPLIAAGGILSVVSPKTATNLKEYVSAGVRRVESMVRENDFVMWPDCTYAPWDTEVSLYAAHFLTEAELAGQRLNPSVKERIRKFLMKWCLSKDADVSAYACHTLAIAGMDGMARDRMLTLYDRREALSALSRARLARAFAAVLDRKRAEGLMKYAFEPQSIKEATFHALALMDLNPDDERIPKLIEYLASHRDKQRFSWGTTAENAHALLAIGAYYQHHPVEAKGEPHAACSTKDGAAGLSIALTNRQCAAFWAESFRIVNDGKVPAHLSWRRMELPDASSVKDEANGLFVGRRYLRSDGSPADMENLVRGEMLIAELTITSDVTRVVGDLIVEDLFAGAFEPVHRELHQKQFSKGATRPQVGDWVMRKDARDDRMLVFSKSFKLEKGHEAKVCYPVRVVSAGDYVLPGPSVEGMYNPDLHARCAPGRIVVRH